MKAKDAFFVWGLIGFLAVLWGSSFTLIREGLEVFSALEVGSIRIVFAFVALLPTWFFVSTKSITREKIGWMALVGIFGSGLPPFLFALAQTKIASSVAGILNSLTPLFTLLLGAILFRTPITWVKVVGMLIGLGGSVLVILASGQVGGSDNLFYALLVVAATICYGLGANLLKSKLQDMKPITITAGTFSIIGPPVLIYLLTGTDFLYKLEHTEGAGMALFYLALLGLIGTAFALVLFNYLIKRTTALLASTVTYLIPVVAVIWGVIGGEQLNWMHLIGGVVILVGIYLSGRKRE